MDASSDSAHKFCNELRQYGLLMNMHISHISIFMRQAHDAIGLENWGR